MKYDIQTKNDLFSGSSLTITIPEDDIDKKALCTIQKDKPEFILPFRFRHIDRQVELVYQIETYCKLKYVVGDCSMDEYTSLWTSVLHPLLDCGDWFMKPYSFVLNFEHLYYDKYKKNMRYLYIPAIPDCSDYAALKEMAAELTKQLSVIDAALENKVLRAIMKDFNPKDFLLTLQSYISEIAPPAICAPSVASVIVPSAQPAEARAEVVGKHVMNVYAKPIPTHSELPDDIDSGIVINIPTDADNAKKQRENKKDSAKHSAKKAKEAKKTRDRPSLFGRKKAAEMNLKQELSLIQPYPAVPLHESQDSAIDYQHSNNPYASNAATAAPYAGSSLAFTAIAQQNAEQQVNECFPETDDATQYLPISGNGGKLWLVGSILLPALIDVQIGEDEVFTIGRHDASVGRQQSSFEFERKTKAISRRHSAIERKMDRYSIIDLSSSAGTYVNGQKLPPNTPYELSSGCRISFGNSGADYVWEE